MKKNHFSIRLLCGSSDKMNTHNCCVVSDIKLLRILLFEQNEEYLLQPAMKKSNSDRHELMGCYIFSMLLEFSRQNEA